MKTLALVVTFTFVAPWGGGEAATAPPKSAIAFVQPPANAQLVGPSLIEITTAATNVDRVEFVVDGALAGVARKTAVADRA